MKLLAKIALMAGVTAMLVNVLRKLAAADDIPTLHPVEDAGPARPEPLTGADLNVAQNSPL